MPELDTATFVIPSREIWEQMSHGSGFDGPYVVIVYDDDWHTFPEVIIQLQKATGCTFRTAHELSHEIDGRGRAVVYSGTHDDCEWVANVLRQIRLQVETDRAS